MKAMRGDRQIEDPDIRELPRRYLLTIGVVADALAASGELDRGQLFTRLVAAGARARKLGRERHIAFAAVRRNVEWFTRSRQSPDDGRGRLFPFQERIRVAASHLGPTPRQANGPIDLMGVSTDSQSTQELNGSI
jgi:hypothetical protein